jgi:thymidylate synthase (FAD)
MKVIEPSYEILTTIDRDKILKDIESAGRTCYKSEDRITNQSAPKFVKMILEKAHGSVIEHQHLSVKFIVDRGVSHELVRHRLASFSQESTRYCNYTKGKFDGEMTYIKPLFWKESSDNYKYWLEAMEAVEHLYRSMVMRGASAQEARSILPNSLKTEIVVTSNLRHWREILKQRCHKSAHPQIREVMIPLLIELQLELPEIFNGIEL